MLRIVQEARPIHLVTSNAVHALCVALCVQACVRLFARHKHDTDSVVANNNMASSQSNI